MDITRCKYIKTLQVVIIVMTKGFVHVNSSKVKESISVKFPKGIISYQRSMGIFYPVDHNRVVGAGLTNLSHF